MYKKKVHYRANTTLVIMKGVQAIIETVDHPDSANVSNTKYVITTPVVWVDYATGEFETQNTYYVPMKETN
jgi:hypothetical protein